MNNDTGTYYVLHEGATQEEAFEWEDIAQMCRMGQLTPDTLVFIPEEKKWKKAGQTILVDLFPESDVEAEQSADDTGERPRLESEYKDVLERIEGADDGVELLLRAAELALELGERSDARTHYQKALELKPYDRRVVAEVKRNMRMTELNGLRFLRRTEPFWENPGALLAYPLGRGPLYVLVPALVFFALSCFPPVGLAGIPILYLWLQEIIKSHAAGDPQPPLWHGLIRSPLSSVLGPLAIGVCTAAQIVVPFLAVAKIYTMTGAGADSGVLLYVKESPVMIVLMFTLGFIYLPAAFMLAAAPGRAAWRALDPRRVVSAIGSMEREYVYTLAFVFALLGLWAVASALLDRIPYLGRAVSLGAGVFVFVIAGGSLGNLWSRFREQVGSGTSA